MYFRKQTPTANSNVRRSRGMTPRMIELSKRLNDIEFTSSNKESAATTTSFPVLSPTSPQPPTPRSLIQFPQHQYQQQQQQYQQQQQALPPSTAIKLRDRMTIPQSEPPQRLGGLDLVEPAKVDTRYKEDDETLEYRQRRQGRESIGSNEGFIVGNMDATTPTTISPPPIVQRRHRTVSNNVINIPSFLAASILGTKVADEEVDNSGSGSGSGSGGGGGGRGGRMPTLAETRKLIALTRRVHESWTEVNNSLKELRIIIASNGGLPINPNDAKAGKLRGIMWLAMLEVKDISFEGYLGALKNCPSQSMLKINNDAFRTLAGDQEFRKCVTTESIVRVLNAILTAPDQSTSDPPRYVQGMNTLLAPFLYVLGESGSFYAFRQFLRNECPLYARPSLPGVHACVQLVDECLSFLDPKLYSHLKRHGAVAKIYAFPAAMTLSANVGPLKQVLKLWDFFLAFGVHLNVLAIIAQLLSMRELLVTTTTPMEFLRSWPPLRAHSVIRRTRELYELLPSGLKKRVKLHAHDIQLAESLASAPQVPDPLLGDGSVCRAVRFGLLSGDYSSASLKRDLSPNVSGNSSSKNNSNCSSRNSSQGSAGRARAKTFSGIVNSNNVASPGLGGAGGGPKRMKTNTAIPTSTSAIGAGRRYGAIGLGIVSSSNSDSGGNGIGIGRQRGLSSAGTPAAGIGNRRLLNRGMRLVAGSEAMWLLDRKLSAEFNDNRPDRPQLMDLNPTIE